MKNNVASLYVSLYRKDDKAFASDEQAAMAIVVAVDTITKALASGETQGDLSSSFTHGYWEVIRRDEDACHCDSEEG